MTPGSHTSVEEKAGLDVTIADVSSGGRDDAGKTGSAVLTKVKTESA